MLATGCSRCDEESCVLVPEKTLLVSGQKYFPHYLWELLLVQRVMKARYNISSDRVWLASLGQTTHSE